MYPFQVALESGGDFLGISELMLFFGEMLFDLAFPALHEGDLLIESILDGMHLLMLFLLFIVFAGNAVELGVHFGLVAALGILAEEGRTARMAHQIKL